MERPNPTLDQPVGDLDIARSTLSPRPTGAFFLGCHPALFFGRSIRDVAPALNGGRGATAGVGDTQRQTARAADAAARVSRRPASGGHSASRSSPCGRV